MSKTLYQSALVIAGGLAIGWLLAGTSASTPAQQASLASSTTHSQTKASRGDHASASGSRSGGWKPGDYDAHQLAGLHQLNHSPLIRLFGKPGVSGLNAETIKALATWAGLNAAQTETLTHILEDAKQRQLAWEKREIKVESIKPGAVRLLWKPTPAELTRAFRDDLTRAFGEETAQSLWQKGDLENFADFCGTATGEQNVELTLMTNPSNTEVLYDIEWRSSRTSTHVRTYLDPNQTQMSLPFRTDHLVNLMDLSRELHETKK